MSANLDESSEKLAIVSLEDLDSQDPGKYHSCLKLLRQACLEPGFFYVTNQLIPQLLLDKMFAESRSFFNLSLEEKTLVAWDKSNRGYDGIGGQSFDPKKPGDLKESFRFGREFPIPSPEQTGASPWAHLENQPNKWPDALPTFKRVGQEFFLTTSKLVDSVLQGFALALNLDPEFFRTFHRERNFTARLLHYPPQAVAPPADQVRCGAHTDWGTLTLLFQEANGDGLEVQTSAGRWIAAPPLTGTVLVNIGDMMERWTNHQFRSTPHRVSNPSGSQAHRSRYSIALFAYPDWRASISPINRATREAPVITAEYILEKLRSTQAPGVLHSPKAS